MRFRLAVVLLLGATMPAVAQISPVEGNWACTANIDSTKAGILTIFAGSYGYASANYGSTASGTGTARLASDGVTFLDGNLRANAGIETGVLSFDDQARDVLILHTPDKAVLTCRPR